VVLDRDHLSNRCRVREEGGDKSREGDVRQFAAGNNMTRRQTVVSYTTISIHDDQTLSTNK
jgi:hypothetical protein